MSEPMWCDVRRNFCTCADRCDDWPKARSSTPMVFTMNCDHCHKTSDLYESFPTCRECDEEVCLQCATDVNQDGDLRDGSWHYTYDCLCKRCVSPEEIARAVDKIEEKELSVPAVPGSDEWRFQ